MVRLLRPLIESLHSMNEAIVVFGKDEEDPKCEHLFKVRMRMRRTPSVSTCSKEDPKCEHLFKGGPQV